MAFRYSPKIVTDGLVLCLDAANPRSFVSGSTTWNDLTKNLNNGVLTNGPTFISDKGGCVVFDGSNDYVNLGPNINLTTGLTYNVWLKTTSNISHLIGAYNNSSPFPGWSVAIGINVPDGVICWWSGGAWKNSGMVINTNQILNVTVTYENGDIIFYLNGLYYSTVSSSTISTYTGDKFLGGRANDGQTPFLGNMYNTSIYDRKLTSSEVLQNYKATKSRFGL